MACLHDHSCEDHDCSSHWSLYEHIDLPKLRNLMNGQENILEAIYEDDDLENDVEMVDVEEGEFVDGNVLHGSDKSCLANDHAPGVEHRSKNSKRRSKKKRNKRKISGSGSNDTDINRFVLDTCRRLKERKSYMVYTAVGCLGLSVLRELINEVDAVQACGGQMTADGKRFRTGGGILWGIIKSREPNAYKEIMKRAKEFEKQFKQPNTREAGGTEKARPQALPHVFSDKSLQDPSDRTLCFTLNGNECKQSNSEEKRPSVHDRLRIPVSYDDDFLQENQKEDAT